MAKRGPSTLCIDIGGTGLKLMVVDDAGRPETERLRVETPHPATPAAVIAALRGLIGELTVKYDRVSVGFPGVVVRGVTRTAPNLDPTWAGFKLAAVIEKLAGKPARALNDAGVQGHGAIHGQGTEVCITLGTGFGFSLFLDGVYVPNIEFGHHPFKKGDTYEGWVCDRALEEIGKKKWNHRVRQVIERLEPTFNYRMLYIGGGNAKKVTAKLPSNVRLVDNLAGLVGGVKLWER